MLNFGESGRLGCYLSTSRFSPQLRLCPSLTWCIYASGRAHTCKKSQWSNLSLCPHTPPRCRCMYVQRSDALKFVPSHTPPSHSSTSSSISCTIDGERSTRNIAANWKGKSSASEQISKCSGENGRTVCVVESVSCAFQSKTKEK